MPIYTLTQSEDGASVRIDGSEVVSFKNEPPRPLITRPLRARPLSVALFADEKAKLQRARKHFTELVKLVNDYMNTEPFHFYEVGDSIIARIDKPIPDDINVILGDVVHNLRSVLDLLVCDLIRLNGSQEVTRDSAFPITKGGIQPAHLRRQLEGMSQRAVKVLSRITHNQPWNEALLLLHRLGIMDKHNSLVAVGAATVSVQASIGVPGLFLGPDGNIRIGGPGPDGTPFLRNAGSPTNFNTAFLTDQELEVYRYVPEIPQQIEIFCGLVFGNGEKGAGAPILQTLDVLSQAIERILVLCERCAL